MLKLFCFIVAIANVTVVEGDRGLLPAGNMNGQQGRNSYMTPYLLLQLYKCIRERAQPFANEHHGQFQEDMWL